METRELVCMSGVGRDTQRRMLKQAELLTRPTLATISPARPESAKTASPPRNAPFPKQGRSDLSFLRDGWDDPHCARRSHPPTHWQIVLTHPTLRLLRNRFPVTCHLPGRGPSDLLRPFLEGVAEAALYCAHRTIYMLPPSLLVISLGMGAD